MTACGVSTLRETHLIRAARHLIPYLLCGFIWNEKHYLKDYEMASKIGYTYIARPANNKEQKFACFMCIYTGRETLTDVHVYGYNYNTFKNDNATKMQHRHKPKIYFRYFNYLTKFNWHFNVWHL